MIYPLNRHNHIRRASTLVGCLLSLTMVVSAQQPHQKTVFEYDEAGLAAQRAGKHEEALQQYAEALKLDPKDFVARFNSGISYMILGKFDLFRPLL